MVLPAVYSYTHCIHTLIVFIHSLYSYTHGLHTLMVFIHTLSWYSHRIHTLIVFIHSLYSYTHRIYTLIVFIHSLYSYTHLHSTYLCTWYTLVLTYLTLTHTSSIYTPTNIVKLWWAYSKQTYSRFLSSESHKRATRHVARTREPEWKQTLTFHPISKRDFEHKTLEVTVWDLRKSGRSDFLGQVNLAKFSDLLLVNPSNWCLVEIVLLRFHMYCIPFDFCFYVYA